MKYAILPASGRMNHWKHLLMTTWLMLLVLVTACSFTVNSKAMPTNEELEMDDQTASLIGDETLYIIPDTAQVTVDKTLRIGAGNIWSEEFVNEENKQQQRITAGLWFFIRNRPDLNQHVRVQEGTIVEVAGYKVRVVTIEEDEGVNVTIVPPVNPSLRQDN